MQQTSQINNFLLRGIGQRLLVLVTHVDRDLLLSVQLRCVLGRGLPLLAAHHARHERLQFRYVRRLQRLFVDVIDQLLSVERTSGFFLALVVVALVRWQEVVLSKYSIRKLSQLMENNSHTSGSTSLARILISSAESWASSSSTSTSSYSLRSLPYNLAGVVIVVVFVVEEVCKHKIYKC